MLHWSFAQTRDVAMSIAGDLIQLAHIQPLSQVINNKLESNSNNKEKFSDSSEEYYRFVSIIIMLHDSKNTRRL